MGTQYSYSIVAYLLDLTPSNTDYIFDVPGGINITSQTHLKEWGSKVLQQV